MKQNRSRILHSRFLVAIVVVAAVFVFAPGVVFAATNTHSPELQVRDAEKLTAEATFYAFDENFGGGGSVATGDVDGDGQDEIIVGAGPGGGPHVRVLEGDGTLTKQFFVYPTTFRGGIRVATCDLNHDGVDEIVTGARQGGGPHVRTLTMAGESIFTPGFFPFSQDFRGGVNVACGDVNGDGEQDIVVGVGLGAQPHVRLFNRYGVTLDLDIRPYADRDQGGVDVAVANVDGGPEMEIITSIYRFGRSLVKVYKADAARTIVGSFEGWQETVQGGFHVAGGDVDNDGLDEVVVAIASGGGPQVRAFEAHGAPLPQNFFPYEQDFRGGTFVAVGDVDGDGRQELITMPGRNTIQGRVDLQKYIEVKLDEQRLYAYANGIVERTFLVSTGIAKYPTPEGEFSVLAKIPLKDYEWTYGPDHPDNYDLKDVANNLRFASTYYLHYAYWHNNFGRRMSHGCVNINLENSAWLYEWADVGTPVIIH